MNIVHNCKFRYISERSTKLFSLHIQKVGNSKNWFRSTGIFPPKVVEKSRILKEYFSTVDSRYSGFLAANFPLSNGNYFWGYQK